MDHSGCLALVLVAALAATAAAPSRTSAEAKKILSAVHFPRVLHPPSSKLPLAEQARAKNLSPPPRRAPALSGRDDVGVLGVQRYPFGLADPLPPERFKQSDPAALSPPVKKGLVGDDVYDTTRLPGNVVPTQYVITVSPNINKHFFHASTDIYVNVIEATKTIILHGIDLWITEVEIFKYNSSVLTYDAENGKANVSEIEGDLERMKIDLENELEAGKHYLLRFPIYTTHLRDDLKGFYLSSYKGSDGKDVLLATTQFEPPAARFAFPCFDEPALKARFKITIEHSTDHIAKSNMPEVKRNKVSDSTIRTEFDETLPMSTYLVAWVVSDFKSETNADTNFTTFGRPNAVNSNSVYLSQYVGPLALQKLGEFTGIPYTMPKVDQFAIPDFKAGAMENWGLVTYREEYLLETSETNIRIRQFIGTTVCHELGHQWTGNLVTLDWWSNTWLNEAFATYFENVICDQILPEWKLMDKYVTDNVHVGIANDVVHGQVAMSSPALTSAAIAAKFDRITYKKGGAVVRMFEHILETSAWKSALNIYLQTNAYKSGSPDRLFRAMSHAATRAGSPLPVGVDVATVAKTWTEQAGVPVVTVERDYLTGSASLKQEQFFYSQPDEEGFEENRWYIPIPAEVNPKTGSWEWSLAAASESKRWLTPDEPSLTRDLEASASEWIVINPQQIGYYLVNYDDTNWGLLTEAMKTDDPSSFHASTRTQLVHDALALARGGRLSYDVALPVLAVLRHQREVAPWKAGINAITFLYDRLSHTPAADALNDFIKDLTEEAYSNLGFRPNMDVAEDPRDTSSDEERYLRFYIASYACNAGNEKCLDDAAKELAAHVHDSKSLHADIRASALCFGVRNSTDLFKQVLKHWTETKDFKEQGEYAAALSCTKDHQLLESVLDDIMSKTLGKNIPDFRQLVDHTISRWENHKFLFDYYKKNAQKIVDFAEEKYGFNLLMSLIGNIRTEDEYIEMVSYVDEIIPPGQFPRRNETDLRLKAANKDLDWHRQHYGVVSRWLYSATNRPIPDMDKTSTAGPSTAGPSTAGPSTAGPSTATSPPAATMEPSTPTPTTSSSAAQTASAISLLLAAIFFPKNALNCADCLNWS